MIGSHYSTFLYVVWQYIKNVTSLTQMKLRDMFSNFIVAHIWIYSFTSKHYIVLITSKHYSLDVIFKRAATLDHGVIVLSSSSYLYFISITLVQVINFATEKRGNIHGKAWILPRLSIFFPWKQFRRYRDNP